MLKIGDFGLARDVQGADYYKKTTDVSGFCLLCMLLAFFIIFSFIFLFSFFLFVFLSFPLLIVFPLFLSPSFLFFVV